MDANDVLRGQYWLTRVVFLRCLGFVYAAAFLSALRDNAALLGEDGLLPATRFMSRVQQHLGHLTPWEKVLKLPTIFWFTPPTADNLFWAAAVGATVSCVVALRGAGNLPAMALLWGLYHSIVNVGQTWYAFGWESQLLETGFLAMFLVPWLSLSRFPEGSPTSSACVWAYRWLLFRIMLGAGLIKLRGDPCWQDLTCMDYHYQTQPNPNPLSRYLHHLPSAGWHKVEVLVNHVVELVLPWCLLLTRRQRCFAGVVQILFQVALVLSGNLSFLNWLTAVPAVFSFDDLHLARFFDRGVVERLVRRLLPQEAAAPGCGGDGCAAAAAAAAAAALSTKQAPCKGEEGGGGRGVRGAGEAAAAKVSTEGGVVAEGQVEPGCDGDGSSGGDGSGDDAGKHGAGGANGDVGEASAEFPVIGSGSEPRSRRRTGPGVPLREIASRRPELARAQSTLQWSSESEDEWDDEGVEEVVEEEGGTKEAEEEDREGGGESDTGQDDAEEEEEDGELPLSMATRIESSSGSSSSSDDDDTDNERGSDSDSYHGGSGSGSGGRHGAFGGPRETFRGAHEGGPETAEKPEPPPLQSPAQVPAPATGDSGPASAPARNPTPTPSTTNPTTTIITTTAPISTATATSVAAEEKGCVPHANDESSRAAGKRGVRATPSRARRALRWAADALLVALVVKGSVPVVKNMAGGGQKMNTSFDSLRIVNTYGNFGSVTKTRGEVVLKGTRHPDPLDPAAEWKEYGFRCKPGDVNQRPCVITPFHYRLDWQMWFAAFQNYGHNPWLVSLVSKLLSTDDSTRALAGSLLRHDPFSLGDAGDGAGGGGGGEGGPPLFVKADLYLYEFTPLQRWFTGDGALPDTADGNNDNSGDNGNGENVSAKEVTSSPSHPVAGADGGRGGGGGGRGHASEDKRGERGTWWTRRLVREYLPPVGLGNPSLTKFLASHGLE